MSADLPLSDAEIAARYAPVFMLDSNEPYLPVALGQTVFRSVGPSPSSKFTIEPAGELTIEYAVYYDWDIGHLYDLEHVWVHVDHSGAVRRVDASSHGGRLVMDAGAGSAQMSHGRPVIYVEAGKHAHWASPDHVDAGSRRRLEAVCGPLAGEEGVHLGNDFAKSGQYSASAADHRRARLKMQGDAFVPAHAYRRLEMDLPILPWPELAAEIPKRVKSELARLSEQQPHFGAILLDCGDTLVDERTEIKEPGSEVVLRGDLIPGAAEMMHALKDAGHKLVLVADGPRQTFENVLSQQGLWDLFDAHVISGDVGVLKPDARMFDVALEAAGLTRADAWRCVMVGNNLSRDIKGANRVGITSVFMAWSSLRPHAPADADEVPDYRISAPAELPALLERLEALLPYRLPTTQFV